MSNGAIRILRAICQLGTIVLLVAAAPLVYAQERARGLTDPSQFMVVELNGKPFASAHVVDGLSADQVYVRVDDLERAIDGTRSRVKRLRAEGAQLFAVETGGCAECRFRITRPVLVSSTVRVFAAARYVPLADVVRAFEGRLVADRARGVFQIHVGKCHWCIIEPTEK